VSSFRKSKSGWEQVQPLQIPLCRKARHHTGCHAHEVTCAMGTEGENLDLDFESLGLLLPASLSCCKLRVVQFPKEGVRSHYALVELIMCFS